MRKFFKCLLLINIILLIFGNLLYSFKPLLFSDLTRFDLNFLGVFFTLGGILFYLTRIQWFGRHIEKDHIVNLIVSHICAVFILFVAVLFNLVPLGILFDL